MADVEGAGCDFGDGDAAASEVSIRVTHVNRPGEEVIGERFHEPAALLAAELGEKTAAFDTRVHEEGLGQPVREVAAEEAETGARGFAQQAVPGCGVHLRPLPADGLRRAAGEAGAHGEVRDVEDGRAAVAAVGEEEAAVEGALAAVSAGSAERHGP